MQDVEDAVLAMASAPNYQHLEKMHFIVISKEEFELVGLSLELSPGETPVEDLKTRHINVTDLSLDGLSKVAILVAAKVRTDVTSCHTFSKAQVRGIIQSAISNNRLTEQDLHEHIRAAIN